MNLAQIVSALWFLQTRSFINSARQRFRRLRQPRYLVGAVLGAGYLWSVFIRQWMVGPSMRWSPAGFSVEAGLLMEWVGALMVMMLMGLSWVFAGDRAALHFTEAELAFLLPAPLSRTALIQYRLLRSQAMILFSGVIFGLFSGRLLSSGGLYHVLGWWVGFSTLSMHGIGASFAVERLTTRGLSGWRRRLLFGLVLAGGLAWFVGWVVTLARGSAGEPLWDRLVRGLPSDSGAASSLLALFESGPASWMFAPARWLVRPWLARDFMGFMRAIVPAVGVLLVHYLWVIRSAVAFEEASANVSRVLNERIAAARSNNWRALVPPKVRRDPFPLAPVGFPPVALLWKNLIATGSLLTRRMMFTVLWMVFVVSMLLRTMVSGSAMGSAGPLFLSWMVAAFLIPLSLMFGPQFLRNDLRSEIRHLDLLKSLPLPEWQWIVGEMAAPWVLLVVFQWLPLLYVGILHDSLGRYLPTGFNGWIGPVLVSLAIVLPGLNALLLLIPNAWVVLFPAWSAPDPQRAPGIENIGQQMLFLLGSILALTVGLLPAVVVGGAVGLLIHALTASPWAVVPAALGVLAVLVAEVALGIALLARFLRRLDVTEAG